MESRTTALKNSFEDLDISFEKENSSNKLLNKRKENRKLQSSKNKKNPSCLPNEETVKNSSSEFPRIVVNDEYDYKYNSGRSRKSGSLRNLGFAVQKDKAKSFVSRLRANTWSPKQSPEFDNIGILHKKEREETTVKGGNRERTWTCPYTLSDTELLYFHFSDEECLSEDAEEMNKVPSKNQGIRDQSDSQSDTDENIDSSRAKDTRCEDINFQFKCFTSGIGEKVPTKNPTQKNTNHTFEERKPTHDVFTSSCFEDKSPREDKSPTFDGKNRKFYEIPTFQHPEFTDSKYMDTRSSAVSLKNGTVSNARLFFPPKNDCAKKSCSSLSPNCTRKVRASSFGGLPRVPSGKLNLVQSGVWQKLRDEDCESRNRSFTH